MNSWHCKNFCPLNLLITKFPFLKRPNRTAKIDKIFELHYIYDSFFAIFQHFSPFLILFAYDFCEIIINYLYINNQQHIFQHITLFEYSIACLGTKRDKTAIGNPRISGVFQMAILSKIKLFYHRNNDYLQGCWPPFFRVLNCESKEKNLLLCEGCIIFAICSALPCR